MWQCVGFVPQKPVCHLWQPLSHPDNWCVTVDSCYASQHLCTHGTANVSLRCPLQCRVVAVTRRTACTACDWWCAGSEPHLTPICIHTSLVCTICTSFPHPHPDPFHHCVFGADSRTHFCGSRTADDDRYTCGPPTQPYPDPSCAGVHCTWGQGGIQHFASCGMSVHTTTHAVSASCSPHHHTRSQCKLLTTPPHTQPVQAAHHTTTHAASASCSPHHHTRSQCKLLTTPPHTQPVQAAHHTTTHAASASCSPHHHTRSQCKLLTTPPHTQPVQAAHRTSSSTIRTYVHTSLRVYCTYIESHYAEPQL